MIFSNLTYEGLSGIGTAILLIILISGMGG